MEMDEDANPESTPQGECQMKTPRSPGFQMPTFPTIFTSYRSDEEKDGLESDIQTLQGTERKF